MDDCKAVVQERLSYSDVRTVDSPQHSPIVQLVKKQHIRSPTSEFEEFLSFHTQYADVEHVKQEVGVVTAGRLSGLKHVCLMDVRKDGSCGVCSDKVLRPVFHLMKAKKCPPPKSARQRGQ